jgi:hypothetical protein
VELVAPHRPEGGKGALSVELVAPHRPEGGKGALSVELVAPHRPEGGKGALSVELVAPHRSGARLSVWTRSSAQHPRPPDEETGVDSLTVARDQARSKPQHHSVTVSLTLEQRTRTHARGATGRVPHRPRVRHAAAVAVGVAVTHSTQPQRCHLRHVHTAQQQLVPRIRRRGPHRRHHTPRARACHTR